MINICLDKINFNKDTIMFMLQKWINAKRNAISETVSAGIEEVKRVQQIKTI